MPHLFMHQRHGHAFLEDLEGADFASLEEARAEAVAAAREIMSDRVAQGRPADGSTFEITDEFGNILLVFPFHDAITKR